MIVMNAARIGRLIWKASICRALGQRGDPAARHDPRRQGDRAERHEHVVHQGDDRRQAVREVLEPEPQVADDARAG